MDLSYVLTDYVTLILLILIVIAMLQVCLFYGMFFLKVGRLGRSKKEQKASNDGQDSGQSNNFQPPVSVVMVANNEGSYLRDNLVYLLEQDYPDYEVVVVDYKSTDDTKFVLKVCSQNYPHLRVVSMPEDVNMFQGRKYPLSIGIRSAKNDILLLTEPECKPLDFNWITEMVKPYANKRTKIVLGYCGVASGKGLMNALQQYDNLVYSAQYLSSALRGSAYTGSGNNLSYRRKFFFDQGAFTHHYTEEYGSDDLFVNQNTDADNTRVCISPNSRTVREAKKDFGQWHQLRRQRVRPYRLHPTKEKCARMATPVAVLLFYAALALLIVRGFPWYLLVSLFVLKSAWQIVAFWQLCKQFGVKKLYWFAPVFEIYFLCANTILKISALRK